MEILKKRSGAVLAAIIIVALSTFFGVHRSLGAACQEVTDSFFNGVYDSSWGASRTSISSQLTKRQEAALGVITISSTYPELDSYTQNLRDARNDLLAASTASDYYSTNVELDEQFHKLVSALDAVSLTASQHDNLSAYSTTFKGAQSTIESAGYNEAVRDFNRKVLNVFPTNLLSSITFVDEPELFE